MHTFKYINNTVLHNYRINIPYPSPAANAFVASAQACCLRLAFLYFPTCTTSSTIRNQFQLAIWKPNPTLNQRQNGSTEEQKLTVN